MIYIRVVDMETRRREKGTWPIGLTRGSANLSVIAMAFIDIKRNFPDVMISAAAVSEIEAVLTDVDLTKTLSNYKIGIV